MNGYGYGQFVDQLNQSEQYLLPSVLKKMVFQTLKVCWLIFSIIWTIKQEILLVRNPNGSILWCFLPTVYPYTLCWRTPYSDWSLHNLSIQWKTLCTWVLHNWEKKNINSHIIHPASARTLTKETRMTYDMVSVGPQKRGRQPKGTWSLHLQKFSLKS